ncbi:histidine kinase [Bacillus manliponensis]|uniref:histidine kinase n=1 Tax=Bacillus manliponensis TaxID=574376 RepID=A0A073KC58_9BACI|nr:HAMP domain-containing sensor histidine kinase [Bacillus manliponensis]KEK19863.1 histidine kinase [Bacillus manliponensis]
MYGELDTKLKGKFLSGIRLKFFMSFIGSIVCATGCIILFQHVFVKKLADISRLEEEYSFIYFSIFLALTILFFYVFSKGMITRLEEIHRSVKEISKGHLDIHIKTSKQDEIGEFANGINEMASNLKVLLEKEKRAYTIKNEMISNISHDLRTPVTSLIGYVELAEKQIEDSQQYVPILKRKSYELKAQIDELLEYCHIHYKEEAIQKEVFHVKELIEQVMIDFVPKLEEANMSFHIQCPKYMKVEVDIKLFVRLLQNIISNSISYGQLGKKVEVDVREKEKNVIIQIINYGPPIEEKDIPYIFERFYRAEKSRNTYTGGKGMGLAIAKSIVHIHNGNLTVSSNEKKTIFTISLPRGKS